MSAAALKLRLRQDLKAAMQARSADEVRWLRKLIAALDNAEAVPAEEAPSPGFGTRAFGDPSGEITRRNVDAPAVEALLLGEIAARQSAANDYERLGQGIEAARLRSEAAMIARYRA